MYKQIIIYLQCLCSTGVPQQLASDPSVRFWGAGKRRVCCADPPGFRCDSAVWPRLSPRSDEPKRLCSVLRALTASNWEPSPTATFSTVKEERVHYENPPADPHERWLSQWGGSADRMLRSCLPQFLLLGNYVLYDYSLIIIERDPLCENPFGSQTNLKRS